MRFTKLATVTGGSQVEGGWFLLLPSGAVRLAFARAGTVVRDSTPESAAESEAGCWRARARPQLSRTVFILRFSRHEKVQFSSPEPDLKKYETRCAVQAVMWRGCDLPASGEEMNSRSPSTLDSGR